MSHSKPNALFWIIAIVFGLLWNAYGVYLFVFETFLATPELFAEMYTPEQLELKDNLPGWYTVVYGIATIGGLLGASRAVALTASPARWPEWRRCVPCIRPMADGM